MLAIATTSTAERYLIAKERYIAQLEKFLNKRVSLTDFERKVLELEIHYKQSVINPDAIVYMIAARLKKPKQVIYNTLLVVEALCLYNYLLYEN